MKSDSSFVHGASIAVISALLLFLIAASGCGAPASKKEEGSKDARTSGASAEGASADAAKPADKSRHAQLTDKDTKAIEAASVAALRQLEKAEGDGSRLGSVLLGDALRDVRRDMARDAAASKIKIRRYGDPEAEWVNFTGGLAGVTVNFIDQGYYVDSVSRKTLGEPSNKKYRFIFTLKKDDGAWKVAQIFESDAARGGDPKTKQDGTINKGTRSH